MKKLFEKELRLSASRLSFLFIAGGLLTFAPGYPILLGAFYSCMGIFFSYQSMRENNDIGFSMLLPVSRADVVKGKFVFAAFIELCSFAVISAVTLVRMTALKNAGAYAVNALMPANFVFLGFTLLIFGVFNAVFLRGFFKTAWYFAKPFITFLAVSFLIICAAETLPHLPGLSALGERGFGHLPLQLSCLLAGAAAYALMTVLSAKSAVKAFEKVCL